MEAVKEKIIKALLNSPESVGNLTQIIGYKKGSYGNITPYLTIMEENNIIEMVKDRSVKGPGSKPTIIKLKGDIPTLKKLWRDYPSLKDNIRFSDYFLKILPSLIKFAKEQIISGFGVEAELILFTLMPFLPPLIEFTLNEGFFQKKFELEGYYHSPPFPIPLDSEKNIGFVLQHSPSDSQQIDYISFFNELKKLHFMEKTFLDRYKKILPEDIYEFFFRLMKKRYYLYRDKYAFSEIEIISFKLNKPISKTLEEYKTNEGFKDIINLEIMIYLGENFRASLGRTVISHIF